MYLCIYYIHNIYLYPQSLKRNQNQHQNLPQCPRQVRCLKYHEIDEIWNTDAGIFLCLFYLLKAMWTMWLQFQVELTVTHSLPNCQKQSLTFNIHFQALQDPQRLLQSHHYHQQRGWKKEHQKRWIDIWYINVCINEKKIWFTCTYVYFFNVGGKRGDIFKNLNIINQVGISWRKKN